MELFNPNSSFVKTYQLPLIIGVIGVLILLIGLRLVVFPTQEPDIKFNSEASQMPKEASILKADISGAVANPGVYELNSESRVQDLLVKAGGLAYNADRDFVSKKINLAAKLIDGGKIYIPATGEVQSSNTQTQAGQVIEDSTSNYNININNASSAELDILSGIGEVTAQKIIDGRPYQTVEELLTKKIVSKSVFEKIKDKISVY